MSDPEEIASHCDSCYEPIRYRDKAWMVTKSFDDEGRPVVEIVCQPCYGVEIPEGQKTIKVVLE